MPQDTKSAFAFWVMDTYLGVQLPKTVFLRNYRLGFALFVMRAMVGCFVVGYICFDWAAVAQSEISFTANSIVSQWSDVGITVDSSTAGRVVCRASHLTSFVGVVGRTTTGIVQVMGVYNDLSPSKLKKAAGFISLIMGCFILCGAAMTRDYRRLHKARIQRAGRIWESAAFTESIQTIRDRRQDVVAVIDDDSEAIRRQACEIRKSRDEALQNVRLIARVSFKQSSKDYVAALAEYHKFFVAFGAAEPSYEVLPEISCDLIALTLVLSLLSFPLNVPVYT